MIFQAVHQTYLRPVPGEESQGTVVPTPLGEDVQQLLVHRRQIGVGLNVEGRQKTELSGVLL